MNDRLEFDEAEARQEEATYGTPAIADRRRLVRKLLDPRPGETVLSIGCGPGFEPAELAEVMDEAGHVHGIDRSRAAMLALAARRCADRSERTDRPEVNEYIESVERALAELYRVCRPGGRAVVCDADFDALVWRSTNPERMERVLDAYDDHYPRPHLVRNSRHTSVPRASPSKK